MPQPQHPVLQVFSSPAWKEKYSYNFEGVTVTDVINRAMLLNYFIYTMYNICPFFNMLDIRISVRDPGVASAFQEDFRKKLRRP